MINFFKACFLLVLVTQFSGCWETQRSYDVVSAMAVDKDRILYVSTEAVRSVNTANFPERSSPELISVVHTIYALPRYSEVDSLRREIPALLVSTHKAMDVYPDLVIRGKKISVTDRREHQALLQSYANPTCKNGDWFDRGTLASPIFFVCSHGTGYKFDPNADVVNKFDLGVIDQLGRFSPVSSPVDRIWSTFDENIFYVQAGTRYFSIDIDNDNAVLEIHPYECLQDKKEYSGQRKRLVEISSKYMLFYTGEIITSPEKLIFCDYGGKVQEVILPAELRDTAFVRGPWLIDKNTTVLWYVSSFGSQSRPVFYFMNLQSKIFSKL